MRKRGAESRSLGSLCPAVSNPRGLQHNGSAFPAPCSYLRSTNLEPSEHPFPGNVSSLAKVTQNLRTGLVLYSRATDIKSNANHSEHCSRPSLGALSLDID